MLLSNFIYLFIYFYCLVNLCIIILWRPIYNSLNENHKQVAWPRTQEAADLNHLKEDDH